MKPLILLMISAFVVPPPPGSAGCIFPTQYIHTGTVSYDSTVPLGYPVGFWKQVELDSHAWITGLVVRVDVTPVGSDKPQLYHVVNVIEY